MPRFPRSYIKTFLFHIVTQGINKSYIFENSNDIKYYINIMNLLSENCEVKILAYCVMNNHTHMLVETEQVEKLSKYMQRLNTKYAKYYNKKYERVGYVFRNRYCSQGIYNEEQLYNCMMYIYNNPVKAGICKEAKDYPYSNYKEIKVKLKEEYTFIDANEEPPIECKNIIKKFLKENNINLQELKEDSQRLEELITILKKDNGISLRKISEQLELNREKVRRLYNKQ
ncbi:MAG: hypothetical protein HFJ47_02755 [Clostridia bacterium]|nr:hypothetical protein [Clostridia bacterium]